MVDLTHIMGRIKKLPTLPEIYVRVSAMLDDDDASSRDIGDAIKTDPSITSRILKVVNSAFYGLPQQVTSVPQALSLLGRSQIRQILMGSVLSRVFNESHNEQFALDEFWRHSIKTAIIARHLGMQNAQIIDHEALFTAGLLHDIGRLVIANELSAEYDQIIKDVAENNTDVIEAEINVLGFDHTQVGEALLESWELPEMLISCVRTHHRKQHIGVYELENSIIYLANIMTRYLTPYSDEEAERLITDIENWDQTQATLEQTYMAWKLADEQVSEVMTSYGMA